MNRKGNSITKMCSFYANDWHLTTMILPYLNKEIKRGVHIATILKDSIDPNIREIITNMGLKEETKKEIEKINWKNSNIYKYENVKEILDNSSIDKKELDVIVNGDNDSINIINKNIDKWISTNNERFEKINIINCYDITQNVDIDEIILNYDYLLNTSGEKGIEEVFPDYKNENSQFSS